MKSLNISSCNRMHQCFTLGAMSLSFLYYLLFKGQIYSVWQQNEKLQREVASLELELKMKAKIAELDKQIQLQVRF